MGGGGPDGVEHLVWGSGGLEARLPPEQFPHLVGNASTRHFKLMTAPLRRRSARLLSVDAQSISQCSSSHTTRDRDDDDVGVGQTVNDSAMEAEPGESGYGSRRSCIKKSFGILNV